MEPWWKGAVIYQIYPRSFFDTDQDGVGDLPGVTERLDYVASLGVDGIWLSPFFTSPMRDFGYDVADYYAVDPLFGNLEDFDALVARAHELDLKVIIDQVYSHTSDRHPWFLESRRDDANEKADWYVWADAKPDGTPPNNWLSFFGGPAWSWDTQRRQYYLHNYLPEQPDLNFHNPAVQNAILDVANFWLARGVDGFRLDVANYYFHDPELRDNPPSGRPNPRRPYHFQHHVYNRSRPENLAFIARLRQALDAYEDRMSVAEISSASHIARSIEYTRGRNRLHTAYNFLFLEAEELTPDLIRKAVAQWGGEDAWPSWSFSNHDVVRAVSRWGGQDGEEAFLKLLIALLCSLRGTIFLYQGEELGLVQADVPYEKLRDPEAIRFWPGNLGRDGGRTPMPWYARTMNAGFSAAEPWLPVDPRHEARAVNLQEADPASTLHFTRNFLKLHREHPALRLGDMRTLDVPEPLLALERFTDTQRIVCVFNLSRSEAELPADALPRLRATPDTGLECTLTDGRYVFPPFGGLVAVVDAD